jgi:hypothetical protein
MGGVMKEVLVRRRRLLGVIVYALPYILIATLAALTFFAAR